jgi:hypothetical protein
MSGFLIALGIACAGWCIGAGIESAGVDLKEGLRALADAFTETDE